jgi:hypothetical protein
MFDHWEMQEQSMPEIINDGGVYIKYKTNNTFISNDGLLAARTGAISQKPCLPIGGATLRWIGPEQLIYDFLHEDDFQIVPIPLQKISVGSDALYNAKGTGNVQQDWYDIHQSHCDNVSDNIKARYKLEYSLAQKNRGNGFYAYAKIYHSRFLTSIELERYKIYDNGVLELHYFEDV